MELKKNLHKQAEKEVTEKDRNDLMEDDGELLNDDDLEKVSGGEDSGFVGGNYYPEG